MAGHNFITKTKTNNISLILSSEYIQERLQNIRYYCSLQTETINDKYSICCFCYLTVAYEQVYGSWVLIENRNEHSLTSTEYTTLFT